METKRKRSLSASRESGILETKKKCVSRKRK